MRKSTVSSNLTRAIRGLAEARKCLHDPVGIVRTTAAAPSWQQALILCRTQESRPATATLR